ncbi:uncharacterized protein [Cardiocondyla obscurior]|uniref:uncharacterized protein isoform X2 n=1 Tax=Cardiocondyla obscurior TaxID=286306 RepID=UPI003965674C
MRTHIPTLSDQSALISYLYSEFGFLSTLESKCSHCAWAFILVQHVRNSFMEISRIKETVMSDVYESDYFNMNKTDFDDNELEAQLYEDIYYSNMESESKTIDASKTFPLSTRSNVETEILEHEPNEQSAKDFSQVSTLAGKKITSIAHECNNEGLEDSSVTQGNTDTDNLSEQPPEQSSKHPINEHEKYMDKNHPDTVYSKYNVVSKYIKEQHLSVKETDKDDNDSDSEESILEVPVPPKPKPPLIDLPDSDEEANLSTDKNYVFPEKCKTTSLEKQNSVITRGRTRDFEIAKTSSSHQNISSKNKNTNKSYSNDTINRNTSNQIYSEEMGGDIVLNCYTIQKGAKNINEIKQLSKSAQVNQENKSFENANRKSRKRQHNEVDNYFQEKRQCTSISIRQTSRDDMPQSSNNEEVRNASNNYFNSMSEEMRNYYNLNRDQETFDVAKLQQEMSKDPKMWAILDEDIMPCPSNKQSSRFWNVRCTNCRQNGHQRYDCSLPRRISCYMCGIKGHTESDCPRKMCLTCGHKLDQCPDLWRRYHQSTDMNSTPQNPGNVMKPSRLLYCCNCTKRGHESSTCREYRWSQHFLTPACVTNYTDGPTYTPHESSFTSDPDIECISFNIIENKTLIPQNTTVRHTVTENVKPANAETLSNANFNVPSTAQETVRNSQMKGTLKPSSIIWPTIKLNCKQTKINEVTFSNIAYSCGKFHYKNDKNARMIVTNLSMIYKDKKKMLNNLTNYNKVQPVFLYTLYNKKIEFEVKIGFTQRRALTLQLLAMKEYIEYLYDLLEYWFDLPEDEKYYGINVDLPLNPVKMFNILSTRVPQLEKGQFTSYAKLMEGTENPRWIYNFINSNKAKLNESNKKNKTLWKQLWRMQVKLLIIVNTEPKPNSIMQTFRDVLTRFESQRHCMGSELDTATYLRLILLYNHLFVPHTSKDTYDLLHRIEIEENRNKNKNTSLPLPQHLEVINHEQRNLVYDMYSPSTSSCTSQNVIPGNFSTINKQNNKIDAQNTNNISLETSKTTDGEIKVTNFPMQNSPNITPLNIESTSSKSETSKSNESQLLTNKVKITSKICENNSKTKVSNVVRKVPFAQLSKKMQRKKLTKIGQMSFEIKANKEELYEVAGELVKMARVFFNRRHMMKAADEMQSQIDRKVIKPKHLKTLYSLIKFETRVHTFCKNLTNICTK